MKLSNLPKIKGNIKSKTKLGRGYSSGHGHQSGRGTKGQKARTGSHVPWYFEGGQLPLVKRLPHVGGFRNVNRVMFEIVKTSKINSLKVKEVTLPVLVSLGIIKDTKQRVKVLFDKDLDSAVNFKGLDFSKSAKKAVEDKGGKVI